MLRISSVVFGVHEREPTAVCDDEKLEDSTPSDTGDGDSEFSCAFPQRPYADEGHPKNVVPDALPVVAGPFVLDGFPDGRVEVRGEEHGSSADMLPGHLGEIADLGVDKLAVFDRLLGGVDVDHVGFGPEGGGLGHGWISFVDRLKRNERSVGSLHPSPSFSSRDRGVESGPCMLATTPTRGENSTDGDWR